MTYHLPPLNALRAFEAAARHLSFKAASAELRVTPGAIGQQVRSLEALLGVALFERVHQGLMLTEAGQRYLTPLRTAFDVISIATQSVAPRPGGAAFVIATVPEFAVQWLLPALDGLRDAAPSLRVKIAEAVEPEVVLRGPAQLAILPGLSRHAELAAIHVVDDRRFPATAPCAGSATLLVADDEALWRQVMDGAWPAPAGRVDFAQRDLAVRAAELGRGTVLASSVEDRASLDARRLLPLPGGRTVVARRWYALCPPGRLDCAEERAVLDCLTRAGATAPSSSAA